MRSTKRSVLLASLLGGTHGGGVSVPKREPPAVPWQNCPWLLQDKVNLRAEDPPRWCFDLQNLGQAFCERGYIGPDKPGVNLYRKCIYAAGKCVMAKDGVGSATLSMAYAGPLKSLLKEITTCKKITKEMNTKKNTQQIGHRARMRCESHAL